MLDDLKNRFAYHPAKDENTKELHELVRNNLFVVANWINETIPNGREKALVLTKLEEAMFWANAAIARNIEAQSNYPSPNSYLYDDKIIPNTVATPTESA